MIVLRTRQQLRDQFAASLSLSLARVPRLSRGQNPGIDETLAVLAMAQLAEDITLKTHPPLCLLVDILTSIVHFDDVELSATSVLPKEARLYRQRVLWQLLRGDPSIAQLAQVARTKRNGSRRAFVGFVARELGRTLQAIQPFPFEYRTQEMPTLNECLRAPVRPDLLRIEDAALSGFAKAYRPAAPLFSALEVKVLSHLSDERDLGALFSYHSIGQALRPVELPVAQAARKAHDRAVRIDPRSAFTSGYAGIKRGGSTEQLGALLPSELATMEPAQDRPGGIDAFDLNLLENRLLYFERSRPVGHRERRKLVVVLHGLKAFDYHPHFVKARWQYFFLAVLFDVLRFMRTRIRAHFAVEFVLGEKQPGSEQIERLIESLWGGELLDIPLKTSFVSDSRLAEHLESERGRAEPCVLALKAAGSERQHPLSPGMPCIQVEVGTGFGIDQVVLVGWSLSRAPKPTQSGPDLVHELFIRDERGFVEQLNRLRDSLLVLLSGGVPTPPPDTRVLQPWQ